MNKDNSIWYLEDVDLMACFCPVTDAQGIYDKQPKRYYKKSEFIYFSDDTADKVFFIHGGAVKIAGYTEEGNEMIKAILHQGEVFGELAIYGEQKRRDYAQAVEDTEVCVLNREDVVGLMRDVSGFQAFFNRLMGERVIYTQKRLESLLFKDAKTRVAEYVLNEGRKKGKKDPRGIEIRNYLTHQEIASFTGTSRQTVTTVLNQFRDQKLLDFDRKTILIKNMRGLEEEAV